MVSPIAAVFYYTGLLSTWVTADLSSDFGIGSYGYGSMVLLSGSHYSSLETIPLYGDYSHK